MALAKTEYLGDVVSSFVKSKADLVNDNQMEPFVYDKIVKLFLNQQKKLL